jgi:5'-nucleotidase
LRNGRVRVTPGPCPAPALHFLLTNDDGISAPGIAALERAIALLPGATCTLVAPDAERSMCGHRLTTHETFYTDQIAENRHSVTACPADCVRVALFALGVRADFVISGVNAGGNLGQDVPVSGTCAGAREAAYHGVPSMAISHYLIKDRGLDWERASHWVAEIIRELMEQPLADGEFWNVNLPHLPPGDAPLPARVMVEPCRSPLLVTYESKELAPGRFSHLYSARYADRPRDPGSDVDVCFAGQVAVARLRI